MIAERKKKDITKRRTKSVKVSSVHEDHEQHLRYLNSVDRPDKISNVPNKGSIVPAKLIKVIDGDTIKAIIIHGNLPLKVSIRVFGIDAPEVTLKSNVTPLHKEAGLKVKEYVSRIYTVDSIMQIELLKVDKYGGRYVGNVYLPGKKQTLAQHLIKKKYVKRYDGGKKEKWEDEEFEYIISSIKKIL